MKPILSFAFAAVALFAQVVQGPLDSGPGLRAASGALFTPKPTSFDCSADGTVVNALTGEPILRAKVNLNAGGTNYTTSTDASGRWTLGNLGCAVATIQVTRLGFLNLALTTPQVQMNPIRLVSGSPVHDIRTPLTPQSVATGKVLDDQGDPVQAVLVTALALRVSPEGRLRFQQSGTANSNDIGEYRLANLQPGRYLFCTRASNRAVGRDGKIPGDNCYPGPPEGGAAGAMDVAAGREVRVDFNLSEIGTVHIRGTVTGAPDGRNIAISIQEYIPNADINRNTSVPVRDGKFDAQLPPGRYLLSADYFEAGKHLTSRVPVNVGNSDVDNVVVHLDEGLAVTGTVRVDSQTSGAVPQFALGLRQEEPYNGNGQMRWGADHATFSISDLVAGSFRLSASPPAPFYVARATFAGQDILNNWIPISQSAGPIEVVLRDDGGALEGDVVDTSEQPVAAQILLLRGSARIAIGFAGDNGHFKLDHLPPGDYVVCAWDDVTRVPYAEPEWMRRYGTGAVQVSLAASQTSQIKLTRQSVPAP